MKTIYFNELPLDKMDQEFLYFLDDLREAFGKPIRVNSSYRDPNYNETVGGVKRSAHTEIPCKAVDIHVENSRDRYTLVSLAIGMGARRIGIGETFLHIDQSTEKVQDVIWTYYK